MARRRDGLADLLILLPWPFAAGLSFVCWIVSLRIGANFPLIHAFTFVFAFLAAVSAFRSWRTRTDLESRQTLDSLAELDWKHFEDLLAEMFRREGYRVEESLSRGADGGIDLRLRRADETVVVQCKRWRTKPVGASIVREIFGLQNAEGAQRAIVVTTSGFTPDAQSFARAQGIELIDGHALLERLAIVRAPASISPPVSPLFTEPAQPERAAEVPPPPAPSGQTTEAPLCPVCRSPMVRRIAKRGPTPGAAFWGCTNYPKCSGTRPA